jgi:hypothetical protein
MNLILDCGSGERGHALAEIDRAKWRLCNGLAERGIIESLF